MIHNKNLTKGDDIAYEWDVMGNPTKWTVKSNMEEPSKKAFAAVSDSIFSSTTSATSISKSP